MSLIAARSRRTVAAVITAALALGSAAAVSIAAPEAAVAAEGACLANPMGAATPIGSADGYTLFVTGDAILANSELEGTLAVGGTAVFGDPRGNTNLQYPVFHGGVGGNADYDVPTVDGTDNRMLLSAFAASKVVQVQHRGAGPLAAGVKLFDRTAPAGHTFGPQFGGSGTTYFPSDGSNMSPQLESAVQPWQAGAGAASFVPAQDAFAEYFPADRGRDILASVTSWKTPAIAGLGEARITLDPTGPNRTTLAALAGVDKFQLVGFAPTAPLVVTVSPDDVVAGRLTLPSSVGAGKDAAGAAISYILWDLSALSGDVTVTSPNEPVRGALYAPDAHIVFPPEQDGGREFEGQLIAKQLTALQGGKEMHTNLFQGLFACGDAVGGFSLEKELALPAGSDAAAFADVRFAVTAEWTIDETRHTLPFTLTAGAASVDGPQDLPVGTVVTFREAAPPTVPGLAFDRVGFSPERVVIGAGTDTLVTATNHYTAVSEAGGGFSLQKRLSGIEAGAFPAGTTFEVTATWHADGVDVSEPFSLPVDGTVVTGPQTLPVGTVVTFSEPAPPTADGFAFDRVDISPDRLVVGEGENPTVTVTNTYRRVEASVGGFSLRKIVAGDGAHLVAPDTVFAVDYYLDGATDPAGRLALPANGETVMGPQYLPAGTVVTFSEATPPVLDGLSWSADPVFSPGRVVVEADASTTVTLTNTVTVIPDLPLSDGHGGDGTDGDGTGLALTGATAPWWALGVGALLVAIGLVVVLRRRDERAGA